MKISIPQPCHENWREMTPNERGRFCTSCKKTVVDFTGWTDKELTEFFLKSNDGICGKFRINQLNQGTDKIQPFIPKRHHLTKVAALSLLYFITAPLTSEAQAPGQTITKKGFETKTAKEQQRIKSLHSGIKGIITDDQTGDIISGATIQLSNAHRHAVSSIYSDTDGHFIFDNLKPGYYKISVTDIGYNKVESQLFEVFEDKFTTVNFPLPQENLMGLTVVTVSYPENPKDYWRRHPWQFIKRRIFK